jgi:hypothetical protein
MSKGGGQTTSTEERTESSSQQVQLGEELRGMSVGGLMDAYNLYNQGTTGIYQGTRLAEEDPLVAQGEQALLDLYGREGGISNLLGMGQAGLGGLLGAAGMSQDYDTSRAFEGGAGDLSSNEAFQDQLASILEESNVAFQRGSVPLFQKGTAAGQYGGSETGEGLGLLGGEINRTTQKSIADAALAQQQLDLKQRQLAQRDRQLAQADIGLGLQERGLGYQTALGALGQLPAFTSQLERGGGIMSAIGQDRTAREQQELMDMIQQFDAPRTAEMANLAQFYDFLASSPLGREQYQTGEATSSSTATQTQPKSDPFSTLLGVGLTLAGMPVAGTAANVAGGSVGGNFLASLMKPQTATSDMRLKTNIKELGRLDNGLGVYSWDWTEEAKEKGLSTSMRSGFMAQEVEKIMPENVVTMPSGYLAIKYDKVLQELA